MDKLAIVTGASSGIGSAIARELSRNAKVALVGRNKEKLEKVAQEIQGTGGEPEVFVCDFTDKNALEIFIENIRNTTDTIDVLVNVAGIWHGENEVYAGKDFDAFSEDIVRSTLEVGIIAPTMLAHTFIPMMPKGSSIINISGTFENGAKGWLPYYVSKKAIEDLTVGLSEELVEKGIRVNAISPSDTATEAYEKYFPQYMDDAIDPKEIARFAARLCSNEASDTNGKVFVMRKGEEPTEGFHT